MSIQSSVRVRKFFRKIFENRKNLSTARTIEDPVVETTSGNVRGSVHRSCEGDYYSSFKGIPYAKPPVGQFRFQDPMPVDPWIGTRDAKKFGPSSAQCKFVLKTYKGSDDCLYLNVYTKNLNSEKKQPVMVWIHGGGFVSGEGDDEVYGPDYLLRKDVVLVTFNYRLGVFGFLNLEDEISPGNYGLKDQVIVLKWVRDNIANFGGDPKNVTIFGESSGSAAVHYLTMSPMSNGLFHKAIMESGVAWYNPWTFREDPRKHAYKMCRILGYDTQDHRKIVEFLRKTDCKAMIEAQQKILPKTRMKEFPFGPGVDSKSDNPFLPIHPEQAIKKGVNVPLLIGHNSRECIMSVNSKIKAEVLEETFVDQLHARTVNYIEENFGLTLRDLKLIYLKDDRVTEDNREGLIDLYSDLDMVLGAHKLIRIQAEKSALTPTYFYKYSYDKTQSPLKKIIGSTSWGACHGDEIHHLFRTHKFEGFLVEPLIKGSSSYRMMEKMVELWVNFATTGNPTPKPTDIVPLNWQPVNNETIHWYLNIDEELEMKVAMNFEEHLKKILYAEKVFN